MTLNAALDAADELTAARDLVLLIELATDRLDRDDRAAINAGAHAALGRLERALELLTAAQSADRLTRPHGSTPGC